MSNRIKYSVINGFKLCGDCKVLKPISEFNRARNHYNSRCKKCLSIYGIKYRQRPEVKKSSQEYIRKYRSDPEKRKKVNEYARKYRKQSRAKAVRNLTRRKWTAREKQKAVNYKGGKCVICGYSKCLAALEFHHKDPSQKEGYGTGALKSHWTFERNKPEIDKCELICVRCHRETHAGLHPEMLV